MAETLEKLVLDFDPETKKELVSVDKDLVKKMKPHQAEGIKFMWDSCYESLKDAKKTKGSGCILAHCMGLGKSFQVVTLVHTLLTHPELNVNTVLVVCPLSTVLNWVNEFDKWLKDVGSGKDIEVYHMTKTPASHRHYQLKDWSRNGGVFVVGYNMYRSLTNPKARYKQAAKKTFQETLVDPGPDLVICDEGHILKNESTALSSSMSRIKTQRRIVLTGTPLQNNLVEYHCMVQFVKPNLLGTKKEFKNRFVNPIQNGQFEDSTAHDVKVMKRRAHVLHKMLDGVVQRKDYNVLTPFLPTKFEYVISLSLSEVQCKLYQHYLDNLSQGKNQPEGGRKATTLFKDWQVLTSLCAHPRVLLMHQEREILNSKEVIYLFAEFGFVYSQLSDESEGSLKDFIDDDDDDDGDKSSSSDSSGSGSESGSEKATNNRQTKRSTRANPTLEEESEPETPTIKEWWSDLVTEEQLEDVRMSPKIALLLSILKKCEDIGDKLLVFSQSLLALNLIEYFLERIDEATQSGEVKESLGGHCSSWTKGLDYFRLDGKTASENRTSFVNMFNQPDNTR
ncbi:hypothetical protein AAG570_003044 [Ranatra chinensis]|uniref:Helicase ATP-binding domain-containing protein n=1 Tax=Ranatra chinensis TaxID=642074 RepID=A0ABD0Y635_9HEMI